MQFRKSPPKRLQRPLHSRAICPRKHFHLRKKTNRFLDWNPRYGGERRWPTPAALALLIYSDDRLEIRYREVIA